MLTPAFRWSLVVAGESLLVLFLLTWGNSFTGSIPLHRAQLVILAGLGGIGWLAILQRPSRLPTLLIVAPLPLLASLVITSIASAYPSLSWFATWQCAAYVGIAWLLAIQASHPVGRRNMIAAMGIVVTVVIGIYLGLVIVAWDEWLSLGFPVASLPLRPLLDGGVVQLPTWVGDVVALCAPVAVVFLWLRQAKVPAIALAVGAMIAVLISGTRAVQLLVVFSSVPAAILLIRDRVGRGMAVLVSTLAIAVVVAGVGAVVLASRSFDEGRVSLYASAADRFGSSQWIGTGPGTYGVLRMGDTVDLVDRLAFPDPGNVIPMTAAESGLVGLTGLGFACAAYAIAAARVWRGRLSRPVTVAALFGISIFVGHALVESVFVLIGLVFLFLAAVSIATTGVPKLSAERGPRSRALDAVLIAGIAVIALTSTIVVRNEETLDSVGRADDALSAADPKGALVAAKRASELSPDNVPAWWVKSLAADAAGDANEASSSAERATTIEGFSQEWLSLAIIQARSGRKTSAFAALDRAVAHAPIDPVVELNAAVLFNAGGDSLRALDSARRLLMAQPDIEPVLDGGPKGIASLVAQARLPAASKLLAEGDADSAFLIALNGEDRDLANTLVTQVTALDERSLASWKAIVKAWFDSAATRDTLDAEAHRSPTLDRLRWSWRLAVHACDAPATRHWERAIALSNGYQPVMPVAIGQVPNFQARLFPNRYPGVVWRMDYPKRPYVAGTWVYESGRPACATASVN